MQDTELLQFIHKTARMGEESLRDIEPMVKENELYSAISSQIREYKSIAGCANRMLEERGEMSPDPGTFSKVSSGVMTAMKMMADNSSSKIAEMVIQGNTMGITKGTKHLNDYTGDDRQVKALAQKLIATEQANVEQMKPFL